LAETRKITAILAADVVSRTDDDRMLAQFQGMRPEKITPPSPARMGANLSLGELESRPTMVLPMVV
jgi:hypothetical protein